MINLLLNKIKGRLKPRAELTPMWRHGLKDWEKVSKDSYKFVFDQSEKRLKEILDEGKNITTRSYGLIGIIAPLLTASLGVIIKKYLNDNLNQLLFMICVIDSLILLVSLYLLLQLIKVRHVWYAGTEPDKIFLPRYMEIPGLNEDEQLKYLYLSEIEQNQHRISSNRNANNNRIGIFRYCLYTAVFSLIIFLGLFVSLFLL